MHGSVNRFANVVRLPDLRSAPTYDDLVGMLRAADKSRDRYCVQSWTAKSGQRFSIRALVASNDYNRLRSTGPNPTSQAEWAFIKGNEPDRDVVWIHSTGDLSLLLNLISAEVEGQPIASQAEAINSMSNLLTQARQSQMRTTGGQTQPSMRTTGGFIPSSQQTRTSGTFAAVPAPSQQPQPQQQQLPPPIPTAPQPAAAPAPSAAPLPQGIVLAGDIKDIELQNVLQSIGLCKMSGALVLTGKMEQASLYFQDGEIVDATLQKGFAATEQDMEVRGDHAFLEVLTWTRGAFSFEQSRRSSTVSIKRKSYALLMEGVMLRDYCDTLSKRKVDMDTRFVQANPAIPPSAIEESFKQGLPLDKELQMRVYDSMRTPICLYDLLKKDPLTKAVWVPVLFNLISLNLITQVDYKAPEPEAPRVEEFPLEQSSIALFVNEIARPDTGLLSTSAFAYFIQRELHRHKKSARQFSLIVFEVRIKRGMTPEPLNYETLRECASRFKPMMGDLDLMGHYQMSDFALLIPEGEIVQAEALLDSCANILRKPMLTGLESPEQLHVTISLFSPDDQGRVVLKQRKAYQGK